ncbi:unnamed protein product [Calypogeia fissa]
MLRGSTVVDLVNAIVPLYLCIALGYGSSRLRILPHEQTYAGISGFNSYFALPFLVFRMISTNDPYHMNLKLIVADTVYKVAVLLVLSLICFYRPTHQSVAWVSSLFNLATMSNSVLIGPPLLTSLYQGTAKDITTLVFMQFSLWISVCILLLEIYKAVYENSKEFEAQNDITVHVTDHQQGISLTPRDLQQGETQPSKQAPEVEDGLVIQIPQDLQQLGQTQQQESGVEHGLENFGNRDAATDSYEGSQTIDAAQARRCGEGLRRTKRQVAKKIAQTVLLKFLWAPVVWASILGFTYALFNFKFNHEKGVPALLRSWIDLIANCTLGMCMFMLGMNMGVAPKLFACGIPKALLGAGVRFIVAPAGMALVSFAVGLRGNIFRFAVMQAMVPQAIVSFVYANQYNIHVDIFSTAVWFQTAIFLPIAIALSTILGL